MRYRIASILILSFGALLNCKHRSSKNTLLADEPTNSQNSSYLPQTAALLSSLKSFAQNRKFVFGQQKATLVGIGESGDRLWGDSSFGNRTDAEAYVGQKVGLMGIDIWDLAMKNPTWNQPVYAKAIRDFYNEGKGGIITLDWHMRACNVSPVFDGAGKSGIPGDGFKINDWDQDSNAECLCKIVNDEPWQGGKSWRDWFLTQKLDMFYRKLVEENLTEIPIIYRPFHEQSGNWFWWGTKSWNCNKHLGKNNVVTGTEAYRKLFRMTVDYLRKDKGLKNLLIAFAPDKLCKHEGHTCDFQRSIRDTPTDEEIRNDYLNSYPGDDYVDILGIDLYYAQKFGNAYEEADYQTNLYTKYLRVMTKLADEKMKVAALTETGNYNLQNEANSGSSWYTNQLLKMLNNPEIKMAYVLTWENRKIESTEYYIPHKKHSSYQDFVNFSQSSNSLFYNDLGGIYQTTNTPMSPPNTEFKNYPACATRESDPDGDGWGLENGNACLITILSYPVCQGTTVDSDNDGFAFENNKLCRIRRASSTPPATTTPVTVENAPMCNSGRSDPDGDGWGFENDKSCKVADVFLVSCTMNSSDPDRDGWGFENGHSCKMREESFPTCSTINLDPEGDGWGVENGLICRTRIESYPSCKDARADGDGDGWGFENSQPCRSFAENAPSCSSYKIDPDGDGWGFENSKSCRVRMDSYPKCAKFSNVRGDGWGFEDGHSCRAY